MNRLAIIEALNDVVSASNQAIALVMAGEAALANEQLEEMDYALFRIYAICGVESDKLKIIEGQKID